MNKTIAEIIRKILLLILPFFLILLIVLNKNYELTRQERTEYYSLENTDLDERSVDALSFDHLGNLWVAARHRGVGVFNGEEWKIYSPNNSGLISSMYRPNIVVDPAGQIWLYDKASGISVFDGENWVTYGYDSTDVNISSEGIVVLKAKRESAVSNIAFDLIGRTWIRNQWGVGVIEDSVWNYFTDKDGLDLFGDEADIVVDRSGRVWIECQSWVCVYENEKWKLLTSENSGLKSSDVSKIIIAPSGDIWFEYGYYSTFDGLTVFDGNRWVSFTEDDLKNGGNGIRDIYFDSMGNVWVTGGNWRGDVSVFDGKSWVNFNQENSGIIGDKADQFTVSPSGEIAFLFDNGDSFSIFNGENWTSFTSEEIKSGNSNIQHMVFDASGNIWVSNWGNLMSVRGVSNFDGEEWVNYNENNYGIEKDKINAIVSNSDGEIWIIQSGVNIIRFEEYLPIPEDYVKLRNRFFSPNVIWLISILIAIMWIAIFDKNRYSIVLILISMLVALSVDQPQRLTDRIQLFTQQSSLLLFTLIISSAVGGLIYGFRKKYSEERELQIRRGMVRGFRIGIVLVVIQIVRIIMEVFFAFNS